MQLLSGIVDGIGNVFSTVFKAGQPAADSANYAAPDPSYSEPNVAPPVDAYATPDPNYTPGGAAPPLQVWPLTPYFFLFANLLGGQNDKQIRPPSFGEHFFDSQVSFHSFLKALLKSTSLFTSVRCNHPALRM